MSHVIPNINVLVYNKCLREGSQACLHLNRYTTHLGVIDVPLTKNHHNRHIGMLGFVPYLHGLSIYSIYMTVNALFCFHERERMTPHRQVICTMEMKILCNVRQDCLTNIQNTLNTSTFLRPTMQHQIKLATFYVM